RLRRPPARATAGRAGPADPQADSHETAPRGNARFRGGRPGGRGRAGAGSERGLAGTRIRAIQSLVLSVLPRIVLRARMLLEEQPAALLAQPFLHVSWTGECRRTYDDDTARQRLMSGQRHYGFDRPRRAAPQEATQAAEPQPKPH